MITRATLSMMGNKDSKYHLHDTVLVRIGRKNSVLIWCIKHLSDDRLKFLVATVVLNCRYEMLEVWQKTCTKKRKWQGIRKRRSPGSDLWKTVLQIPKHLWENSWNKVLLSSKDSIASVSLLILWNLEGYYLGKDIFHRMLSFS